MSKLKKPAGIRKKEILQEVSAIKVGAFYRDWGQNEFIFRGPRVLEPCGKRGEGGPWCVEAKPLRAVGE